MKKSTLPTRLLALGAVFATAAALAVGSAGSAQAAKPGARGDVSSATASISAEAKAAGVAKHGAKATDAQALEAYWTPERMRAAKPAEEDSTLEALSLIHI